MKRKIYLFIYFWLFLFVLGMNLSYGKVKNVLKEVIFLKEPVERLIFEFENIPKYEIEAEKNILKIKLFNTYPGEVSWVRKLPKEKFKEINISLEKDYFFISIKLEERFNFRAQSYENKLIIDLIWEKKEVPQAVIIKGEHIFKKTVNETERKILPKYEFPPYQEQKNFELPFTKEYKGTPISVDFQEADLHAIFRLLAEVGKINIVVSEKAKGNITLKLYQVPWDQVLDIVLANFGLGMIKIGNVLRIAPIEEIKAESDKYRDYLTSVKDIQERGPLITKTFQLKYIKADRIIDRLREVITTGGEGRISYDPFTNLIIAKDTEKNLMEIEKVIREIDKPTKQVLIEARIVEVQDTYAHRLGIRWRGAAYRGSEHTILGVGRNREANVDIGRSIRESGDRSSVFTQSNAAQSSVVQGRTFRDTNIATQGTTFRDATTATQGRTFTDTTTTTDGVSSRQTVITNQSSNTWDTSSTTQSSNTWDTSSILDTTAQDSTNLQNNVLSQVTSGVVEGITKAVGFGLPLGTVVDLGTAGNTNIGFIFGHIGKSVLLLDVELSALESKGVARIFAKPKIITLDHQEAEIKQGYRIPYLQLTQFGVATTQFLDAVLRLKVTPHITPDNRLNLEVEVEKSTPDFGTVVQGVPAIITRYAKTRVLINSGDTFVIGGIKTDDVSENVEQVPGLSKVPALQELFKRREKDLRKTELMVFITPKIVSIEIPGLDY